MQQSKISFHLLGKCCVAQVYCLMNTMYSQSIYRFAASMPHCISFNTIANANAKHVVNGIL